LRAKVTALLQRAGLGEIDVRVEAFSRTTRKVDAYFAGQGPTRAILLSDTLLEALSEDEVVAAVAHEAAYIEERRWPGLVAAAAALLAFLYLTHQLMLASIRHRWFGVASYGDIRTLPVVMAAFFVLATLGGPLSAAHLRSLELAADLRAVALTGAPQIYRSMLQKAGARNLIDPAPPRWAVWLGHTHPPLSERLAAIAPLTPPAPDIEAAGR
jgi:STE24 endopeptidase